MKTTKKGFTLIELIVVIAIIGVLAAILVPTMLGYVKKSKISSANSTAASIYKAFNSAIVELDEEGNDVGGTWEVSIAPNPSAAATDDVKVTATVTNGTGSSVASITGINDKMAKKIYNFFADINKLKETKAKMDSGACVGVVAQVDSTYIGTFPSGIVTTDSFDDYKNDAGFTAACTALFG